MFTSIPEKFGSLSSEQIFNFENAATSDITIKIADANSGDLLGVKKFYSTASAEVNVSPIVKQYAIPQTAPYQDGFFDIKRQGYANVILTECESGVTSEPQILLLSENDSGYAINSTMSIEAPMKYLDEEASLISAFSPSTRALSIGESDTLLFAAPAGTTANMEVAQYAYGIDEPVATRTFSTVVPEPGFVAFNLLAKPYVEQLTKILEPHLDHIELKFSITEHIEESPEKYLNIDYQIIDVPLDGVRLAWVSHKGSIEHYTFPVVKERTLNNNNITNLTLCSALETEFVRTKLAQIVKSPRIWVVTTDPAEPEVEYMMIDEVVRQYYTRAELLDKSVKSTPENGLAAIEIKIAYTKRVDL